MMDDNIIIEACKDVSSMAEACAKTGLHFNTFKRHAKRLGLYKPNQGGKGTNKNSTKTMTLEKALKEVFVEDSGSMLSGFRLKMYLFRFNLKENRCEKCGLDTWLDQPISLELEHRNGNHYDNRLENLEILCPNCHAQTATYRGKKKSKSH